jgi:hypothetical protein
VLALEPPVLVAHAVVAHGEHGRDLHTCFIEHGSRAALREHLAPIGAADAPTFVDDGLAALDGAREWQLVSRIGASVFREQLKRLGVLLDTDPECGDAVHACRGVVDEHELAVRIGNDDTFAHLGEGGEEGTRGSWHAMDDPAGSHSPDRRS